MKRSDFLRCLAAVIVAPSIVVTGNDLAGEEDPVLLVGPSSPKPPEPQRVKAFWYRIKIDEVQDQKYMEMLMNDPGSYFWMKAQRNGIDLNQPYTIRAGYDRDDFIKKRMTVVVKQTEKAAA